MVVLLAATSDEAYDFATQAELEPSDCIVPTGIEKIEGLRLDWIDLIVQFPGFAERQDAREITEALLRVILAGDGDGPLWEHVGTK